MARVTTSNYLADAVTQFAWATTDNDFFDREDDLYNLSQAVELHTHASGRGLAIERIASNTVTTDNLQALSVTTDKLANLNVTTGKLADDAVTLAKLQQPMIQTANNMSGGYTQRETGGVYDLGFYMAGNGLAVLGAGPAGSVGSNIIMGQSNQVSIGSVQGAGKFNVMQTSDAAGGGSRVYASNQTSFLEFVVLASNHITFRRENFNFLHVDPTFGYMTIGPTSLGNARLTLRQASDVAAEGLRWNYNTDAASGHLWGMTDGSMVWNANGRILRLDHPNNSLGPDTDGAVNLGSATRKWGSANMGALTCTTITASGTHTINGTTNTQTLNATTLSVATSMTVAAALSVTAGVVFPSTTNVIDLGSATNVWKTIYAVDGLKDGGGDWDALSDDRAKMKTKFRKYTAGLDVILQLEPTWFTYNGDFGSRRGAEHAGFRSEEIAQIAPEMVKTYRGPRRPGEEEEDFTALNLSNLKLMFVNAIKELHTRLEALEARN